MPRSGRLGPITSPAAAGGATDHGALTGLADDDHPQYETAAEAQALVDTHVNDTSAAHAASAVSASSTTLVGTATDLQGVLEELDNGIADHLADTTDAHAASAITFTPAGTIAATTVQAAIAELLAELTTPVIWTIQGTPVVTTNSTALRWKNRTGRTLTVYAVCASAVTAPASTDLIFDLNKDGTTMYTTQGNRPTLAVAANTVDATLPDVLTVADGSYLTMNVDQVGATVAGVSFQVFLKG